MSDAKDRISEDATPQDSVGHGEWRDIAPDSSDAAVPDLRDNSESDRAGAAADVGELADELDPDDVANDMSVELGLGYRDYGIGSQPTQEDTGE